MLGDFNTNISPIDNWNIGRNKVKWGQFPSPSHERILNLVFLYLNRNSLVFPILIFTNMICIVYVLSEQGASFVNKTINSTVYNDNQRMNQLFWSDQIEEDNENDN